MAALDAAPLPAATERSSYALWTSDDIRYADTDRQGHVNNAVYATFCETARVGFLYDGALDLHGPSASFAIVRLELDFRAELFYPATVDIGTRVLAVGQRSFRLGHGIFSGALCAATAECVMVLIDNATRKATALTPQARTWLEARRP
ncbi:MAG TPA: thioesterase family protein [Stellaceae bacterium]|jgi:acyl-CoA thioester hydrolase|nr:thioesterase family protein [Stellaceae bacterium]